VSSTDHLAPRYALSSIPLLPRPSYWRIKTNQEIDDILKRQNIIGFIKKQTLNRFGHVELMAEGNIVQKMKRWKPMSKRPIGRPKTRWEDGILEDIKSRNIRNWKKIAQNGDSWRKVVEQARTLYRLQRFVRRSIFFSRKSVQKFQCSIKCMTIITDTLHQDQYTLFYRMSPISY